MYKDKGNNGSLSKQIHEDTRSHYRRNTFNMFNGTLLLEVV